MHMQPLTITNNEKMQQFETRVGIEQPYLEYRISDGVIHLMHTDVPDSLSGQGIGSALTAYAFDYARRHHLQVKAYCPFVRAWLQRHPDQADIAIAPQ
jgi:uncharacterized protein